MGGAPGGASASARSIRLPAHRGPVTERSWLPRPPLRGLSPRAPPRYQDPRPGGERRPLAMGEPGVRLCEPQECGHRKTRAPEIMHLRIRMVKRQVCLVLLSSQARIEDQASGCTSRSGIPPGHTNRSYNTAQPRVPEDAGVQIAILGLEVTSAIAFQSTQAISVPPS